MQNRDGGTKQNTAANRNSNQPYFETQQQKQPPKKTCNHKTKKRKEFRNRKTSRTEQTTHLKQKKQENAIKK